MYSFTFRVLVKHPRKVHKCYLCGENIRDKHIKESGRCNDYFFSHRIHIECLDELTEICDVCLFKYDCQHDMRECFLEERRNAKP